MVVLGYQNGAVPRINNPARSNPCRRVRVRVRVRVVSLKALYTDGGVTEKKTGNVVTRKPKNKICTADELHYVAVPNSDWRLALWRYLPSPAALQRNHPLLLLSGIGTNAIGYDLSPEVASSLFISVCLFPF